MSHRRKSSHPVCKTRRNLGTTWDVTEDLKCKEVGAYRIFPKYIAPNKWGHIHKIFFLFLHENRCCGFSFAELMNTHNICFCGEIKKFQYFSVDYSAQSRVISYSDTSTPYLACPKI